MIYGNYRTDAGRILVTPTPAMDRCCGRRAPADHRAAAQTTLGYVSQFLRTIPRVSALDIVAAAAREAGRCRRPRASGPAICSAA